MKKIKAFLATALIGAVFCSPVHAKKKYSEGVPVKVVVMDEVEAPIATAVIRHPEEADRHRVNAVDGSWETSILYMPDGTEIVFVPGMVLQLEISAPGYMTQVIQYDVRKRNNKIPVTLVALELDSETVEEPVLQFGRDKPRETGGGAPAN